MPMRRMFSDLSTGALAGVVLTAPLIAVLFAMHAVFGLPFAPFEVFDWVARRLPGALITFGIDTMVAVISRFGIGEISETAKAAERTLAIGGLVFTGTFAGAVLFVMLRRFGAVSSIKAGMLLGALFGGAVALIGLNATQAVTLGAVGGAAWTMAAFIAWGGILGWTYPRFAGSTSPTGLGSSSQASVERIDRRHFIIRVGGAAAGITVVGASVGAAVAAQRGRMRDRTRGTPWSAQHALPNSDAAVTPVPGTRSELTPVEDHYQIDINSRSPMVDEATWRLRIDGLVDSPAAWSLSDLKSQYEPLHQFITLACISNPIGGSLTGTQRWTGIPVRRLLEDVQPRPDATHLHIRSMDDFHETLRIEDAMADERIMLTYAWDGLPLPNAHGFPLRLYVPDRYGMKQPKWIASIAVSDHDEDGYWVSRGWDREARMRATAVIDTIGVDMMVGAAGPGTAIPIGGIAHAGARGISRVELRVDDGEWIAAALREPIAQTTWVIWRVDWPFTEGDHTFTVRCVEGDGTPQIEARTSMRPAGATGLHSKEMML